MGHDNYDTLDELAHRMNEASIPKDKYYAVVRIFDIENTRPVAISLKYDDATKTWLPKQNN